MTSLLSVVILVLIGLILLLLEVLVIPGTSIAGIFGFLALGTAVWIVFSTYGTTYGVVALISLLLLTILTFVLAFRSKTWNKLALSDAVDSKIDSFETEKPSIGAVGQCISRLNPIGTVEINGREYEAYSADGYIEENNTVVVIATEDNKIIVKRQN